MACVFCGLALRVVELSRNCDDGICDAGPQVGLGGGLHFAEHEGPDLGGRVFLASDTDPSVTVLSPHDLVGKVFQLLLEGLICELSSYQTFSALDGVFRVGQGLAFGGFSYESLSVLTERYYGGSGSLTFCIFQNLWFGSLHYCYA